MQNDIKLILWTENPDFSGLRLQVKRTRKKIKRLEELPGYSLTLVNVTNTLIQPVGSNDFALKTGLTHLNG